MSVQPMRLVDCEGGMVENAREILENAIKQELHSVIVFGILPDGGLAVMSSANRNVLEVMGALEAAKLHLWSES